jgi:hypothetical protein
MSEVFTMTMGASRFGAPVGVYKAAFNGMKQNTHPEFGPGVEWSFTIQEGEYAGQQISRTTAAAASPGNSAGRMVAAMTGRPLAQGEKVDFAAMKGKMFSVVVERGTGAGTRVATATPIADSAPPAPTSMPRPVASDVPPPPPPRRPTPAAKAPLLLWADWGNGSPILFELDELRKAVIECRIPAADLLVCVKGSSTWTHWAETQDGKAIETPF